MNPGEKKRVTNLKAVKKYAKTKKGVSNRKKHSKNCRLKNGRRYQLKEYGLTLKDYDRMFEIQEGLCAICRKPESKTHQSGVTFHLSVDHNHETGKVRELLCACCNHLLGQVHEDIEVLMSAALYLERHRDES